MGFLLKMPSAAAAAGPRQSVDQPGAGPHCGFLLSCLVGAGPLGGMKASPENVALTRSLEPAGRSAPAPAPCPVQPSELADGRAVGERHAAGPRWALCGQGSGPLLLDMTRLVLLSLTRVPSARISSAQTVPTAPQQDGTLTKCSSSKNHLS